MWKRWLRKSRRYRLKWRRVWNFCGNVGGYATTEDLLNSLIEMIVPKDWKPFGELATDWLDIVKHSGFGSQEERDFVEAQGGNDEFTRPAAYLRKFMLWDGPRCKELATLLFTRILLGEDAYERAWEDEGLNNSLIGDNENLVKASDAIWGIYQIAITK